MDTRTSGNQKSFLQNAPFIAITDKESKGVILSFINKAKGVKDVKVMVMNMISHNLENLYIFKSVGASI